jgi:hypothetical protein
MRDRDGAHGHRIDPEEMIQEEIRCARMSRHDRYRGPLGHRLGTVQIQGGRRPDQSRAAAFGDRDVRRISHDRCGDRTDRPASDHRRRNTYGQRRGSDRGSQRAAGERIATGDVTDSILLRRTAQDLSSLHAVAGSIHPPRFRPSRSTSPRSSTCRSGHRLNCRQRVSPVVLRTLSSRVRHSSIRRANP